MKARHSPLHAAIEPRDSFGSRVKNLPARYREMRGIPEPDPASQRRNRRMAAVAGVALLGAAFIKAKWDITLPPMGVVQGIRITDRSDRSRQIGLIKTIRDTTGSAHIRTRRTLAAVARTPGRHEAPGLRQTTQEALGRVASNIRHRVSNVAPPTPRMPAEQGHAVPAQQPNTTAVILSVSEHLLPADPTAQHIAAPPDASRPTQP